MKRRWDIEALYCGTLATIVILCVVMAGLAGKLTEEREKTKLLQKQYEMAATECRVLMDENDRLREVIENYGSN